MDKKINLLIKNYSDNADLMNKLVVAAFLQCPQLKAKTGFLGGVFTMLCEFQVSRFSYTHFFFLILFPYRPEKAMATHSSILA